MGVPCIPNIDAIIAAGIDPKTGLPLKMGACGATHLKNDIAAMLKVVDRQDAVNRYEWEGLPQGLDTELIERILYHKGQLIVFKMSDERFYALPYALAGNIDVYGRWRVVKPLTFGSTDGEEKPREWIKDLTKIPVYAAEDNVTADDACVIVRDYTNGVDQTILPRVLMNNALLGIEAECVPLMRTALINASGITGVRVNSDDESANVFEASKAVENAAMTGHRYVPIIGNLDFQAMDSGNVAKAEEYMLSMQSLDNFRLSTLGIENGGLFEKKARELQAEADVNAGNASITLEDGLKCRKDAADLLNKVFGLNIKVRAKSYKEQTISNLDYSATEGGETNDDV